MKARDRGDKPYPWANKFVIGLAIVGIVCVVIAFITGCAVASADAEPENCILVKPTHSFTKSEKPDLYDWHVAEANGIVRDLTRADIELLLFSKYVRIQRVQGTVSDYRICSFCP